MNKGLLQTAEKLISWLDLFLGIAIIGIVGYLISRITPDTAHGGGFIIAFVLIIAPAIAVFFVAALAMERAAPWRWWIQPVPFLLVAITSNSDILWRFEWLAIFLMYGPVVALLVYLFFGKSRRKMAAASPFFPNLENSK
jgi:hypothetical protein